MSERKSPLPLALAPIALLFFFGLLPAARANPRLAWSILGAAGALLLYWVFLARRTARSGRALTVDFLPKPVHYVQLAMHSSVYAYWGWYWPEVYRQVPLIIAQIFFVYALDSLVCWSRRDRWILGFGGFPIVMSANLFLMFKPDWFFLQFLMLATGVLCKEFVTWEREGRRTHIFNPSAIALFIFSMGLIAARLTPISWASEIAVSFNNPPLIYIEIFLLGLVVQALFSVTLITLAAAATLYALNLVYFRATGLYFFVDTGIPAAVFLGLHLLVTDPATSPRRDFGKVVFGALYGAAVFALYRLLDPYQLSFYDKLLCVPPLNLTVRALDRAGEALAARLPAPAWWPARPNRLYMAVWSVLFAVMAGTGFLSPRFAGADPHFWGNACAQGRGTSCRTWIQMLKTICEYGSRQACLDLGNALTAGPAAPDPVAAIKAFARVCEKGDRQGCDGFLGILDRQGGGFLETACDNGDGESCFILGSLYATGQGLAADAPKSVGLFRRACSSNWSRGCFALGESQRTGKGTPVDPSAALENFEKACAAGMVPSCFASSSLYGAMSDPVSAERTLRRGCALSAQYAQASPAYVTQGSPAPKSDVPAFCAPVLE